MAYGGTLSAGISGSVKSAFSGDTVYRVELREGQVTLGTTTYALTYGPDGETITNTVRSFNQTANLPIGTHQLYVRAYTLDNGFGDTPAYTVTVLGLAPVNDAQLISFTGPPSAMAAGQNYNVSVRMRNSGTSTWLPSENFRLGAENPQNNYNWGFNRVLLSASVAPGAEYTFSFGITAPATSGTYNFQWRMLKEGFEWFGTPSTNVAVTVSSPVPPPAATLSSPLNGAKFFTASAAATSAAVPVTGSATAAPGAAIAKIELLDGATVLQTVFASSISTSPSFALGPHALQLRTTDSLGKTGSSFASITVEAPASSTSGATPVPVTIDAPHLGNADAGTLPGNLGVNPSGAATYGIDIVAPPGTAGLQPALSINYNSAGTNGPLGLGWSLGGLSSIHRCGKTIAQDGVNNRIAFETSDRLCLDGQRLVLVNLPLSDANYWAATAEYRTEIDSFTRVTTSMTNDRRSFKAEQKDGKVVWYGSTPGSYVNAVVALNMPAKSGAQSWAIASITDRIGNHITFEYEQDAQSGEHLPAFIRYGGNGLAAHAAIKFEYEDRPDAWKRYIDESRNDMRRRVTHIKTYVASDMTAVAAVDDKLVRDYELGYEKSPSSGRSLLASVKACARNPQTAVLECLPETSFAWGKPNKGAGFESKGTWTGGPILTTSKYINPSFTNAGNHSDYFAFSDFENHGYTDVLEKRVASAMDQKSDTDSDNPIPKGTTRTQYRYFHNTGTGFAQYSYKLNTGEAFVVLQTGDFDGDGVLDLLTSTAAGPKICLSPLGQANALGAPGNTITFNCTTRPATGSNLALEQYPYAVDVKGDGRTALYGKIRTDGAATLYIQNEVLEDLQPPSVVGAEFMDDGSPAFSLRDYVSTMQMVDFSGIGKPYDVRWNRARFTEYTYDADGTRLYANRWVNLTPTVSITGFKMPAEISTAGIMSGYAYPTYPVPAQKGLVPYLFDKPQQGAGLSADFNGSGYNSLAFGFMELAYDQNFVSSYRRAETTVCLSTGRALDCGVRAKYSGAQYSAVRALGNFVGDGQPSILTEKMIYQAGLVPEASGEVQMCSVTGDDTSATSGADTNITCVPWPGVKLPGDRSNEARDQVYFMDLQGTGRMQLLYYHSGTVVTDAAGGQAWVEDGRWELFAPVDQAVAGQALDRIYQVTNGLGAVSSVEYADGLSSGIVRKTGTRTAGYPMQYPANPGKLVRKLRTGNGLYTERSIGYRYEDPAFDAKGRGLLGFGKVISTDDQSSTNPAKSVVTTRSYRQPWPYSGMEEFEETSIGSVKLSSTTRGLSFKSIAQTNGANTIFPYVSGSVSARNDLDGSDLGTTSVSAIAYDNWGNLTSQSVSVAPRGSNVAYVTATATTFRNNSTGWLIGLPTRIAVTKTDPVTGTLTRTLDYDYDDKGLMSSQTVEPGNQQYKLVTKYSNRNTFGIARRIDQEYVDPESVVVPPAVPVPVTLRVSDTEYDANGRFPITVTKTVNNVIHSERAAYAAGSGVRVSLVGPNKLETRWIADGFGRTSTEIRADGNETRNFVKQCNSDCPPGASLARVTDRVNGSARTVVPVVLYSDNAGHVLRTKTWGAKGGVIVTDQRYDSQGRLWETDQPRFEAKPAYLASRQSYDDLNRVTKTVTLDEAGTERPVTTAYKGLVTELTNARNYSRVDTRNVIGQVKVVRDAKLKLISFDYEPFGNLSKTVDPNGNVITVEYDLLGRKTNLRDPDLGWIHYDNNPLGQTYAQISPRQRALGQKTGMKYDQLGRMTARYETDLESHWVFDTALTGIGQLAEAYTGTASAKDYRRIHSYDSFGRPKQTQQVLTDGLYNSTLEYDTWGRVVRHTQQRGSDGAKIFDSRYDSTGGVSEVLRGSLTLWKVSEQDAALRAVALALGNGLTQTRVYNRYSARVESGELKPGAGAALLTEGYHYDEIGSVTQRTQYWDVGGFQESFEYDELNRIRTSEVLKQAPQTFAYDDAGNIKTKTNVGTGPYVYPAQGAAAVRPHAVQSIPGIGSFAYDLNGNLETGAGRAVAWTSFDMPQKIEKDTVSATFAYGTEHQRTRQNRSDGSVVVYAGAQEVETKAGQVTVKTYWPGGIGVEIDRRGAATELRWMHIDRLGSVIALTDQNGAISERLAYDAWGKRRTLDGAPIGATATPDSIDGQVDNRGFTGHEMLDQLDLVHMNGRVYDPFVAKFMSGDPLIQDPANGQNYNRYSYVLNNPTNFTDPTGFACDDGKSVCKGMSLSPQEFGDARTLTNIAENTNNAIAALPVSNKARDGAKVATPTGAATPRLANSTGAAQAAHGGGNPCAGKENCIHIPGKRELPETSKPLSRVFLVYTAIAGDTMLGHHLFVKVVGADGPPFYLRGGPSPKRGEKRSFYKSVGDTSGTIDRNKQAGYGNIRVDFGEIARQTDEGDALFSQYVGTVNVTVGQAADALTKFGNAINVAQIPYLPASQNSNAVATQSVQSLGLPRPTPLERAPGHATILPVPIER